MAVDWHFFSTSLNNQKISSLSKMLYFYGSPYTPVTNGNFEFKAQRDDWEPDSTYKAHQALKFEVRLRDGYARITHPLGLDRKIPVMRYWWDWGEKYFRDYDFKWKNYDSPQTNITIRIVGETIEIQWNGGTLLTKSKIGTEWIAIDSKPISMNGWTRTILPVGTAQFFKAVSELPSPK